MMGKEKDERISAWKQRLLDPSFKVLRLMYKIMDNELAEKVIKFYETSQQDENLIIWALEREVEASQSEGSCIRGDSTFTTLFTVQCSRGEPLIYLQSTVLALLKRLKTTKDVLEIDPRKADEEQLEHNLEKLEQHTAWFIERLICTKDQFPRKLSRILYVMRKEVQAKYPTLAKSISGSFLFLRYICPALVSPQFRGVTSAKEKLEGTVLRSLVLISKVMSSIVNNVLIEETENLSSKVNAFIEKNVDKMHGWNDYVAARGAPRIVDNKSKAESAEPSGAGGTLVAGPCKVSRDKEGRNQGGVTAAGPEGKVVNSEKQERALEALLVAIAERVGTSGDMSVIPSDLALSEASCATQIKRMKIAIKHPEWHAITSIRNPVVVYERKNPEKQSVILLKAKLEAAVPAKQIHEFFSSRKTSPAFILRGVQQLEQVDRYRSDLIMEFHRDVTKGLAKAKKDVVQFDFCVSRYKYHSPYEADKVFCCYFSAFRRDAAMSHSASRAHLYPSGYIVEPSEEKTKKKIVMIFQGDLKKKVTQEYLTKLQKNLASKMASLMEQFLVLRLNHRKFSVRKHSATLRPRSRTCRGARVEQSINKNMQTLLRKVPREEVQGGSPNLKRNKAQVHRHNRGTTLGQVMHSVSRESAAAVKRLATGRVAQNNKEGEKERDQCDTEQREGLVQTKNPLSVLREKDSKLFTNLRMVQRAHLHGEHNAVVCLNPLMQMKEKETQRWKVLRVHQQCLLHGLSTSDLRYILMELEASTFAAAGSSTGSESELYSSSEDSASSLTLEQHPLTPPGHRATKRALSDTEGYQRPLSLSQVKFVNSSLTRSMPTVYKGKQLSHLQHTDGGGTRGPHNTEDTALTPKKNKPETKKRRDSEFS